MVWDASKSPGDLITSSDWNDMVTDQKSHASRHSDGGSDELDAADLAGGLGTSGQVLQSDGSAASWVDFSGGHSVSDSGTQVLAEPDDVNFNSNLTVTDDGDGSVTVDASGGGSTESTITVSSSYTTSGETTVFVDSVLSQSLDGFEDGDFTSNPSWNNTSGTANVQTNTVKNGTYAVALEFSDFSAGQLQLDRSSVLGSTSISDGFKFQSWIYTTSSTSPKIGITNTSGDLNGDDGVIAEVDGRDTNFNLSTRTSGGSGLDLKSVSFADAGASNDNWYRVEVFVYPSSNSVDMEVYDANDTLIASISDVSTSGTSSYNYLLISEVGNGTSYFDDIVYDFGITSVTLSSSDASDGKIVRVVDANGNAGANSLTVDTEGSETINGEPDAVINNNYEALTFQSDGSDWYVVSRMSGGGTV